MKKINSIFLEDGNNFENKWGKVALSEGWIVIPTSLIRHQTYLNINATELNILLILLTFWWKSDNPPFPSKQRIANIIQCDISTVRKNIKSLEEKGLITREFRKINIEQTHYNQSNKYHFDGLIEKLTKISLTNQYIIPNE